MATGDNYTSDQLENIRKTLQDSLGDRSGQALESLESRFTAAADEEDDEEKLKRLRGEEKKTVDVDRMIVLGRLSGLQSALRDVKDEPAKQKKLVTAILEHREAKAGDLVEAMASVSNRADMIEALVAAITAQKGVNPLIDAMRHATISPKAVNSLARSIAEQGTVNHLIRTIGTAPRNQPDAEVILSMEVMRKGSVEQMIEALNLLDDASPGIVIIASGVVNRKEVGIEPLVRAMSNCKNNTKAAGIFSLEVTKRAEPPALITLLERYISDDSDAGEILTAKLVNYCMGQPEMIGLDSLLMKACRHMHADSMAGKILILGILDQKNPEMIESANSRLYGHPKAKQLAGYGAFKHLSFIKATRLLGKEYFKMSKIQPELEAELKEIRKRFHWVIVEILGEEIIKPEKAVEERKKKLADEAKAAKSKKRPGKKNGENKKK